MFRDIVAQWLKLSILLVLLGTAARTSLAADEPLKPDELRKLLKESRSAEAAAKPKFKQDGDDLMITLEILINGCADVHSTSWKEDSGVYHLHYSVVQNLDSYVRNVRGITLEWRLRKHKMGEESKYPVTGAYWAPTNAELQVSGPELKKLERVIKKGRASANEPLRTAVEQKLVGTWLVADADRKQCTFTDLKFKEDGTGAVVHQVGAIPDVKYQVIGKQLVINQQSSNGSTSWEFRIESVTETELVLEPRIRGLVALAKIHYLRAN